MTNSSKIGLGTVQFGLDYGIANTSGKTSGEEVQKIIKFCSDRGIRYLDTAMAYGTSEEVLGKVGVEEFKVVSKFMPASQEGDIASQLNASLGKLGLKKLYGYLAHRPEALLNEPDQWRKLQELKDSEKALKIGYSLNRPGEIDALLKAGMSPDLIQVPYNLFDRRFESHMRALKEKGCEIHTRSTFLQGLFFMSPQKLPDHFNSVKMILRQIQEEQGNNLAGTLLKHVLSKDFIDIVILGVEKLSQLRENLEKINSSEALTTEIPYIEEEIVMPSLWPAK